MYNTNSLAANSAVRRMHAAQIIVRLHNFQNQCVGCYATPLCKAMNCAIPYKPDPEAPELSPDPEAPELSRFCFRSASLVQTLKPSS